jgi:hypothetical protein
MNQAANISAPRGWNVELFRRFWDSPSVETLRNGAPAILTEDAVGVWPHGTVLRGQDAYVQGLIRLLTAIPDFHATVKEYASNGEFTFIRWEATGTYEGAPFVAIGADRVRRRGNLVAENLIMSDHPVFRVVTPA